MLPQRREPHTVMAVLLKLMSHAGMSYIWLANPQHFKLSILLPCILKHHKHLYNVACKKRVRNDDVIPHTHILSNHPNFSGYFSDWNGLICTDHFPTLIVKIMLLRYIHWLSLMNERVWRRRVSFSSYLLVNTLKALHARFHWSMKTVCIYDFCFDN